MLYFTHYIYAAECLAVRETYPTTNDRLVERRVIMQQSSPSQPPGTKNNVPERLIWQGKLGPAFWTIASAISLTINLILIIVILLLGQIIPQHAFGDLSQPPSQSRSMNIMPKRLNRSSHTTTDSGSLSPTITFLL